jgi:hypothetical protein
LKALFQPSAEDFLRAQRLDLEWEALLNHIIDEVVELAMDPTVDGESRFVFPTLFGERRTYSILYGQKIMGRSFWYIYEPKYDDDLLLVHNIGDVATEPPQLSRR